MPPELSEPAFRKSFPPVRGGLLVAGTGCAGVVCPFPWPIAAVGFSVATQRAAEASAARGGRLAPVSVPLAEPGQGL